VVENRAARVDRDRRRDNRQQRREDEQDRPRDQDVEAAQEDVDRPGLAGGGESRELVQVGRARLDAR
jgi:hypothetical protein